jgi:sulfur-carrier protein
MGESYGITGDNQRMENVRVRLFAAARAAAATDHIDVGSATVNNILAHCIVLHPELARIIPQCSFLIDGVASHDLEMIVNPGSQIDVLPKFAGG